MDYLMTIGAACDLGFRVRLAGKNADKKLLFEVYRPTADPNHKFSTKWGNLQQAAWAFGDSDYANVAIVQGAGEGDARATVTVGLTDATGADRRELYVDARDGWPMSSPKARATAPPAPCGWVRRSGASCSKEMIF